MALVSDWIQPDLQSQPTCMTLPNDVLGLKTCVAMQNHALDKDFEVY